jgi:exosortase F-associated protein
MEKMHKLLKIVVVVILGALLVLLRRYESAIFYDPLLSFFKSQSDQALPQLDMFKLIGNITLRYTINTIISLGILWVIFLNKEILRLSAMLYSLLFLILITAFCLLIFSSEAGEHMALFYVRRFLIQPLFLLILIPAFYFQKNK